jgi:hypothetical protein
VGEKWRDAPWWLKVLAVLGVPWCLVLVAVGTPMLLEAGPGLLVIWAGLLGLTPWGAIAVRRTPGQRRG